MTYTELESFYTRLVNLLRTQGIACAITSGLACVNYGVVESTNDCDLLCDADASAAFLTILESVRLGQAHASYRGATGAPLDARWLRGGWTSHFLWRSYGPPPSEAYLDVFGDPPRGTGDWRAHVQEVYADRHTVAEMKRTNRERDWPYATALGVQMLTRGDERGWLHIFEPEVAESLAEQASPSPRIVASRPVLELIGDARLKQALHVEREYWAELNRQRLAIYQRAVRPYAAAVRQAQPSEPVSLADQHRLRVRCAESCLPPHPVALYGLQRMIDEARAEIASLFAPSWLHWLPDVYPNFRNLGGG
jgi:hypothetical protein